MPNERGKSQKLTVRPSARAAAYRTFHLGLINELRERHHFTGVRAPLARNYSDFAAGKSGMRYSASFARQNEARTEIHFSSKDTQANKARFDALAKDKTEIEAEFGEPLRWERDIRTWSRIAAYRPGSIEDRKTLPEIHTWAIDRLLRFKKVFGPRLQRLA